MMGIGIAELLILGVVGIGGLVALVFVVTSMSRGANQANLLDQDRHEGDAD